MLDVYRRERLLQADNLLACTNVYLLRGVVQLGRLLSAAPKDISIACVSATDVWHTYVCCSQILKLETSAVRIVFLHFESNRIVIVGLKSHQY